ncbi:MAG: hypothetical protein KatS3mg082_2713 [Nitrospiraceae bacterium]|nr:MAG: hypothetical protein KatS3mg082_2713 [Nitrospiraceae bacterium]GIW80416.1 MAG: hypothetical protein KatS3mg105_2223 [Gemmatales bacterium]GIW81369.1 MAG: hypothetical protein KatS3mg105_3176 [Gemmatales bacterium]GIW81670.1 MAG: hypothetical protein KatS3mg105_3477 [Gemmatales bacterium]
MRRTQREVEFEVFRGRLARHVRFPDGRGYTHHCTLEVLEQVAFAAEERAAEGVTTQELWDMLADLPTTQISVALDFLKDRGCLETRGRRSYPATATLYEDAMTEFHYLAHVASERPDASSPPPGF